MSTSGRHPTERALFYLIGALVLSVPVGAVVSTAYPLASRRVEVAVAESLRVGMVWFFNTVPILAVILVVAGLFALGVAFVIVDWARGLLA